MNPKPYQIFLNGVEQQVTFPPNLDPNQVAAAIDSPMFKNWVASFDPRMTVKGIEFQSIDMFGSKVGFIKFKMKITDTATGKWLPDVVFMRSDTVAILVVLESEEDHAEYAVLAVQARPNTGQYCFAEVLAGCLDDTNSFAGAAAHELSQETDGALILRADELIDLAKESGIDGPIYLSPGGCTEAMRFFLCRRVVSEEFLESLRDKATGVPEEGEFIKLKLVPVDDLETIPDAKTLVALHLYRMYIENP